MQRIGTASPGAPDASSRPEVAEAPGRHLRLGTRGSPLALAQSALVAEALRALGASVEIVTIRTVGDVRAPDTAWGEGAFVGALEVALLDRRIDVAVHSAKDVPTAQDPRLVIAAFPTRGDPRDALVGGPGATLAALPRGARIGTDSPRRAAFLVAHRPDLRPHPLHGNVDTRLRRLAEGETDALILAVAGLARLGLTDRISEVIPADVVPPAPGQGALAVQCRADDPTARAVVERLDDAATRAAVEAERAFLAATGGGCRAPLGALGSVRDGTLDLLVGTADPDDLRVGDAPAFGAAEAPGTTFTRERPDGGEQVRISWARGCVPVGEGAMLAESLARGVAVQSEARVLVTRDPERAGTLIRELATRGLVPFHVPTIGLQADEPGGPLDVLIPSLSSYDWVVVTSPTGAKALGAAATRRGADLGGVRIASVGAGTSAAVERAGGRVAFQSVVASAAGLAAELPTPAGTRVLLVRGNLAGEGSGDLLRGRGALVDDVIAYRTTEGPAASTDAMRTALRLGLAGVAFTSGSTVRGLLALLSPDDRPAVLALPAFCIGPSTASAARSAGFAFVYESSAPDSATLAELVRTELAIEAHSAGDAQTLAPSTREIL